MRLRSLRAVPGWPGRWNAVRLVADEVNWGGVRLERLEIRAGVVRLGRSGVDARSMQLEVTVAEDAVDELLESGLPYARLELADDGLAHAMYRRRPGLGRITLTPAVRDGALMLVPTAVTTAGGTRLPAPAWVLPRLRIAPDVLLPGSRLTGVQIARGLLHLQAEMPRLVLPIPTPRLGLRKPADATAATTTVEEQPAR